MRNETEITKDIAYLKQDIFKLESIGGSCTTALDDLEDLYAELRIVKQNDNGSLDNLMISLEEYEKLMRENDKLKLEIENTKSLMIRKMNEYILQIDELTEKINRLNNRTFWKRIINKQMTK